MELGGRGVRWAEGGAEERSQVTFMSGPGCEQSGKRRGLEGGLEKIVGLLIVKYCT